MSRLPDWIAAARDHWRWRGDDRPPFALAPGPGQVSVWDFPRPPRIEPDRREIVVRIGDVEIARTRDAVRVLETGHPPSFYLPWKNVSRHWLRPAPGGSFCEWKGPARYWQLVDVGGAAAAGRDPDARSSGGSIGWSYSQPMAGAEAVADCVAFYPAAVACFVDGARVLPQPGGFYGGWITPELVGPFKGAPGSEGW